jgi:hypothetical protein
VNSVTKTLSFTVLCGAMNAGFAQQPSAADSPPENGAAAQTEPTTPAPPPAAKATPPKATAQSEAGEPRANTSRTPAAGARAGSGQKTPETVDRLELGTATVTGDREQPKVMYIVPWKKSDIGDLTGKPMNSLVDEILAPVDRDVFKREVLYYKAVQAEASQNGAPRRPSEQGEK